MKSLEKELAKRIEVHKYQIIASCLIIFEKKGIYNSPLLIGQYGDNLTLDRGENRAFKVADELLERCQQGETEYYNKIYKMCWNKMKHRLDDKKAYNLDNADLQEY